LNVYTTLKRFGSVQRSPHLNSSLLIQIFRQIARAKAVQAELKKKLHHEAKENGKVAQIIKDGGAIAGVGLITPKKEPGDTDTKGH
jgi:hypothetical protein